ncbi:MAG: nucleotide exchange factor GrpE [Candidatus Pacebacteria bacterium]|nr:nucleotide exchange factor GrpE [Candidatus Paceibacterota bacterium]
MNKKELEECEKKKQEFFSGWQREKADFINYKKKEGERLMEITEAMKEELLFKLLPVLDSFNLAEKNIPLKEKDDKNLKGLLLIKKQLEDFMRSEGVEEILCSKEFNPALHEAVGEIAGESEEGTIAEEMEKGYQFKGTVIRPAKVKVYKLKN